MTSVSSVTISSGSERQRPASEGREAADVTAVCRPRPGRRPHVNTTNTVTESHCHTVTLSHWHWGTVMLQPEIRGSPLIGKFSKFVLMRRSRSVRLWRVEGYREVSIYYASHHLLDGRDINFLLSCKHFQFILMIHSCRTRYNLDICYSFSVLSFLWKHFPFTIPQLYLPF